MNEKEYSDYSWIAEVIEYLQQNFREQPSLEAVAKKVHLSLSDFQKLFIDWAGVSAERFMEYISVHRAKQILNLAQPTLFETPPKTGLSGTAKSHDSFVEIERMTPERSEAHV